MKFKVWTRNHKLLFAKLCILSFLVIVWVLFLLLKLNPDICETWTNSFIRFHVYVHGTLNSWIPFSLTEFFMISIIVIGIIYLLFCLIDLFKKRWSRSLYYIINVLLIVFGIVATYQVTCEMAYNRHEARLTLYQEKVDKTDFRKIVDYFISDLNMICEQLEFSNDGNLVEPYSLSELSNKICLEYKALNSDYLFDYTTNVKPMITSFLYREFHITGVTFMPLGEANVNYLNVNSGKPFTVAHELAHTKGAMREGDADLFAAYITLHSSDPYIRFSGYTYTFGSLLDLLNYTGVKDEYIEAYFTTSQKYQANNNFNYNYWKSHNTWGNFAKWVNDIYLKLSGQDKGTGSYGDSGGEVDPTTKVITSFSSYQKMYFDIFYNGR